MTSLHGKWSPKAMSVHTKEDDGGVAACLNWSYGRQRKAKEQNNVMNQAIKLQEAVDIVLENEVENKVENRSLRPTRVTHTPCVVHDRPTLSPRDMYSRAEVRTHSPEIEFINDMERSMSRTERPEARMFQSIPRRAPTPAAKGRCIHTHPANRTMNAWGDNKLSTKHEVKKAPMDNTKKFLKKYFNRPLSDTELRYVLKETHKRISDDIVEETLNSRSERHVQKPKAPQPPSMSKSCTMYNKNGYRQPMKVVVPRKNFQMLADDERQTGVYDRQYDHYDRQRPFSAHHDSRDTRNMVTWDKNVHSRPQSAITPGRSQELTSQGKHFSSWRPNGSSYVPEPWTQSTNNYDDVRRMASTYKRNNQTRRSLGATRFNNNHTDAEREYLQVRPASQQGKVNLQMDCPDDTDMLVSVRIQKSRASTRY